MPEIDVLYLLMAAFGVLGLIEWIKSLVDAVQKLAGSKGREWHATAWTMMSLALSLLVAAAGDGGVHQVLTNAILILAVNEVIGYNVVVRAVFALVDRVSGVGAAPAGEAAGERQG